MVKKCFSIVVLSLAIMIGSNIFAQTSKNMVVAGIVPVNTMYGRTVDFTKEQTIADVWGWTYQGKEYALICLPSNHVLSSWDETTHLSGSGVAIIL